MKVTVPSTKNLLAPLATFVPYTSFWHHGISFCNKWCHSKKNVWTENRKSRKRNHFEMEIWIILLESKKSPENSGVLLHAVSKTVKHEVKNKKVDFLVWYQELQVLQC